MADEKETFPDRLDSYVSAVLDRMDFRPRDRYHPNSEYEKDRARRLRNIVYDLKAELEAENAELAAKLARAQAALLTAWRSAEKSTLIAHKQALDEAFEYTPKSAMVT